MKAACFTDSDECTHARRHLILPDLREFRRGIVLDRGLGSLLETCRRNNTAAGVTGMLLYKDGNFMQVLEGEEGNCPAPARQNRARPPASRTAHPDRAHDPRAAVSALVDGFQKPLRSRAARTARLQRVSQRPARRRRICETAIARAAASADLHAGRCERRRTGSGGRSSSQSASAAISASMSAWRSWSFLSFSWRRWRSIVARLTWPRISVSCERFSLSWLFNSSKAALELLAGLVGKIELPHRRRAGRLRRFERLERVDALAGLLVIGNSEFVPQCEHGTARPAPSRSTTSSPWQFGQLKTMSRSPIDDSLACCRIGLGRRRWPCR